jgi:2'-5' RNA ligase
MPRPNWFFAFPVDGAFVLTLPEPPPHIRRFHHEDVHLTLAWLGGCGQPAAERALAALDARLSSSPPPAIDVTLAEVVPMGGSRRDYTALSALLGRGRDETAGIITDLRDALTEPATGRREKRPAKPHVTVARPKPRAPASAREAGLSWASNLDLRQLQLRLDRIALFTWSEDRKERLFRIHSERRLS